jgi:hypothetical protein
MRIFVTVLSCAMNFNHFQESLFVKPIICALIRFYL